LIKSHAEQIAGDMLFTRDNLVNSIDTEQVYTAEQVTDYIDEGIHGVLGVLHKQVEPWSMTIDICQSYFDKINN
jgi:hypothetical protein